MTNNIYQIKIVLNHSKPSIWRRVLILSNTSLLNFHDVIQITMGWEDCHLHQFVKNKLFYSFDNYDGENYEDILVSDLLTKEKDKMVYEYDFGDSWLHDIILEKILPFDSEIKLPTCIAGEMCCPPEDCGGIWSYEEMKEVVKDPKHENYKEYINWLGKNFNPEFFDIKKVNKILVKK
jgi:hypothetical protein